MFSRNKTSFLFRFVVFLRANDILFFGIPHLWLSEQTKQAQG
jgi:hypothetical protein